MARPRISVFIATSLDGFIATEAGGIDWLSTVEDEHGEDYGFGEFFADVDAVVMGRKTYDMVAGFDPWPFEGKRVVVLSHRDLGPAPEGVERYEGALALLVARLGDEGMRRVYLDGGEAIRQGLAEDMVDDMTEAIRQGLAEDMVDDMTLSRVPVMLGKGRPLFGPEVPYGRWQLLGSRHYPTGLVQATYRRLD